MESARNECSLSRREMLQKSGWGLGALAMVGMAEAGWADAGSSLSPLAPRRPHFPARAKRVLHIFANGGASQVDTFDPKPALQKYAGKPVPGTNPQAAPKAGAAFPSAFSFGKYGRSGIEVSEIFPRLAECVDDLCVIRSMHTDLPGHEPALMLMNCGESRFNRPSVGSWLTYGLGSENQNLPGFVVLCPKGLPVMEAQNWQAGFLPAAFQGTYIDSQHAELEKLIDHIRNKSIPLEEQRRQLDVVLELNRQHQASRRGDAQLEARLQSFELAYRMQMEAADAFDLTKEPKHILDLYGPSTQGRSMLMARRLLERGVRFVQVWAGQGQPWDDHENIATKHRKNAESVDQAMAAILKDLKQRGMLEDTLVVWGGEFGRTPATQLPQATGRDHNHHGFSMWLAGGGVKGGMIHGATDEFGFKAVENPVHVHDLHATILHLLGFDHEKFTYRYAGRDFRLTDVHGQVVSDILA